MNRRGVSGPGVRFGKDTERLTGREAFCSPSDGDVDAFEISSTVRLEEGYGFVKTLMLEMFSGAH